MELYHDLGLDALIAVGGDGTMTIAGMLTEKGANVVGVPQRLDLTQPAGLQQKQ